MLRLPRTFAAFAAVGHCFYQELLMLKKADFTTRNMKLR